MTTVKALRNLALIVTVAAAGTASLVTVPALRSESQPAASTAVHAPLVGQSPAGGDVAEVVVGLNAATQTAAPIVSQGGLHSRRSEATPTPSVTRADRGLSARTAGSPPALPRRVASGSPVHIAYASSYGIGDGFLGGHLACGGRLDNVTLVVANRTLPCGTRLVVCFRGRCTSAVVMDRGPYVTGRDFDLGPAVARAVRFSGLGTVTWRVAG